tara:strand:+ start:417 stop:689 length:273 start_codon:yes stop_codon:yes gene_type:complete
MKILIYLISLFLLNIGSISFANSVDCKEFKKLSVDYFNCKANKIKDKTISSGQNIIKDTKNYQKKEWSKEKKKMKKVKEKINKTKEKVLN